MDISQFSGLVQFCLISLLFAKTLREKCPKTGFFLVRIFLYSVQIQKNADQKKLRLWTLFTQCFIYGSIINVWQSVKKAYVSWRLTGDFSKGSLKNNATAKMTCFGSPSSLSPFTIIFSYTLHPYHHLKSDKSFFHFGT